MHNTYRLAGHTVKIESVYPQVHTLCADYRTDDPPEYIITTTEADIAFERAKSARENLQEGAPVQEYESSYLETLAVYRKLAQLLVQDDILLMHGAVVAVDGQAYLFTAKSGTGKTTHTRLWLRQFGACAVMVNGDKPLIHISRSFFADSSYMLSFSVLCSCVCSRLISPSVSSWHKQANTLMHQSPGHIQRRTPYNF